MNKAKLITILLFFGISAGAGIATAVLPKESFSENQNRYLAQFPKFTAKRLFSGAYTDDLENYISDHFIMREKMSEVKTNSDILTGKKDVNGIYITGSRLIEKIDPPDDAVTQRNIGYINDFAEFFGKPVFVMLVPTQAEIYRDELPPNAPNPDQKKYIEKVSSQLTKVSMIDVYGSLSASSNEYIYYRTDHHWTTHGAFYAYQAAAKKMGFEAQTEDHFDHRHSANDFRGTFYSKTLYNGIKPDTLDIWIPSERSSIPEPKLYVYNDIGAEPEEHSGLYFNEFLERKDKYSVFFGQNQPLIKIETGTEGGRLLVIKDSYAHCFVPFLTEHYSEITMIDTRYVQTSINELADPENFDQALILYNASTFMDGITIRTTPT